MSQVNFTSFEVTSLRNQIPLSRPCKAKKSKLVAFSFQTVDPQADAFLTRQCRICKADGLLCVCMPKLLNLPPLEKWLKNLILKICVRRLKSVGILKARIIARSISGALIYIKYLRYPWAASPEFKGDLQIRN